jgi:O-antigen/teichoic acid export membrane protein
MLIGIGKHSKFSTLNIVEKSTNTLFILLFIFTNLITPFSAIVALILSSFSRLFLILYYLRNDIKFKIKGIKYIIHHIGSFTFFNYIAASCILFSTHIVVILTGSLGSLTEAGWYGANMIIINALRQLANTTGLFAMPKLSKTNDPYEKRKLKRNITAIILGLTVIAAIIFMTSASWMIPFMFGKGFVLAVEGFKVLLIGMIFCSLLSVFQSFITSDSKNFIVVIAPIVLIICTIITSLISIPTYGSLGAAYSWTLSHAIACIVSLIITLTIKNKSATFK